jgi:hypothetical protein
MRQTRATGKTCPVRFVTWQRRMAFVLGVTARSKTS